MIQAAIAKGMTVFSLTEHMPRDCVEDLYPEEVGLTLLFIYISLHMRNFLYSHSRGHIQFNSLGESAYILPPNVGGLFHGGVLTRVLDLQ